MAATQQNRDLGVITPLGEDVLLLTGMSGVERLGRPFVYELDLASEKNDIAAADLIGQNITIRLSLSPEKNRYFNGYISRFRQISPRARLARYQATMVPWLWFLTRAADCRIFQNKTVPDIIKDEIFKKEYYKELVSIEDGLSGTYRTWENCVQYRETDFNFVSRLMEQEGIYYFFKHEDGKHTLVLADSAGAHEDTPDYETVVYHAPDSQTASNEVNLTDLTVEQTLQPCSYALNDFDFENSRNDMIARANVEREHIGTQFEIYDYPGEYVKLGDGEGYARKRIEELQAQYEIVNAVSETRGLFTGSTFTLDKHTVNAYNRKYLLTAVNLSIEADEYYATGSDADLHFNCNLTAIEANEPFRSPRQTPKPTIAGAQTALIVGPAGEEIYTDKYGRVKVKFHWDRYTKADENSSCWIRVGQVWAGKNWGAMYIPRIGQEVIVEFLEGDPDHPIITGRVYNAQAMPPYDLPAEQTKSTIKTNSSKGGGGFNEIRFEDKKGKEQVFIHAQNNYDQRVKNTTREFVGNERHLIVKKDQLESVEGDQHNIVQGDQKSQVDGDQHLLAGGSQLAKVGGDQHITISGDRTEKIGGDLSTKTSNNLKLKSDQTISIQSGMDYQEKVGMNYAMDAGMEVHLKAGMKVIIEAGMQISLVGPGGFIDIGPAGVSISGTLVNINSGGAAGSGRGSSPKDPADPEAPDAPEEPKVADSAQAGEVSEAPPAPAPPTPTQFSPQATTLKEAAKDGTPFCEKCEEARQQQSS